MPNTEGLLRLAYDPDRVGETTARLVRLAHRGRNLRVALRGGPPGERAFLAQLLAGRMGRDLRRVDLRALLRGNAAGIRRALDMQMADLRAGRTAILYENAEALEAPRPAGARRSTSDPRSRFLARLRQSSGLVILSYGGAAAAGGRTRGGVAAEVAFGARPRRRPSPERPTAAMPAPSGPPSAPPGQDPTVAYNFRVNIGTLDIGFCEVSAFGSVTDLESLGADELLPQAGALRRGFTRFRPVRMRRGLTESKVLFAWRNEILKGKADVRDIGIRQFDARGETVVNAWILGGAWPIGWIGPAFDAERSAAAFEEVEILYRDILWL